MGITIIPDCAKAEIFSAKLFVESMANAFWLSKFIGTTSYDPSRLQWDNQVGQAIVMLTDLEREAGDNINVDITYQLSEMFVEGDDVLAGKEEQIDLDCIDVGINQLRKGVDCAGKMARKTTKHGDKFRQIAKDRLSQYFSRIYDEMFFVYSIGLVPDDPTPNYILPAGWAGFAGNALSTATNQIFGGGAANKAAITAADTFELPLLDHAKHCAQVYDHPIHPIMIDGKPHFGCVLHPAQVEDLRASTTAPYWQEIQMMAGLRGDANKIFTGALGIYNGVILYEHPRVPHFNTWGTGAIEGASAIFFGANAFATAWGSPGSGLRMSWHEEFEDRGNRLVVDAGTIFGMRKITFDSQDLGIIEIATAAEAC